VQEAQESLIARRQTEYEGQEHPAWAHLMTWADWEIEKQMTDELKQHQEVRGPEDIQVFAHTSSSKKPRFAMIPYAALEALAARFDLGEQKHGPKPWNALSDQAGLQDEAWITSRIEHVIHHAYQYLLKRRGLIPDDGDDDAAAIMWGGVVLSEAKRVKESHEA
jgi:hypothetical protein